MDETNSDRFTNRSKIAQTLAENGLSDCLVLSRESISSFGISEWGLIETLEDSDTPVEIGNGREYTAAKNLAKRGIVSIEENDTGEGYLVSLNHTGPVVAEIV